MTVSHCGDTGQAQVRAEQALGDAKAERVVIARRYEPAILPADAPEILDGVHILVAGRRSGRRARDLADRRSGRGSLPEHLVEAGIKADVARAGRHMHSRPSRSLKNCSLGCGSYQSPKRYEPGRSPRRAGQGRRKPEFVDAEEVIPAVEGGAKPGFPCVAAGMNYPGPRNRTGRGLHDRLNTEPVVGERNRSDCWRACCEGTGAFRRLRTRWCRSRSSVSSSQPDARHKSFNRLCSYQSSVRSMARSPPASALGPKRSPTSAAIPRPQLLSACAGQGAAGISFILPRSAVSSRSSLPVTSAARCVLTPP